MKKIFTILFTLLGAIICFSQPIVQRAGSANTVNDPRGMNSLNFFLPRYADTTSANLSKGIDSCGAVIYTYADNLMWQRACSPKHWTPVGARFGLEDNILTGNRLVDMRGFRLGLDSGKVVIHGKVVGNDSLFAVFTQTGGHDLFRVNSTNEYVTAWQFNSGNFTASGNNNTSQFLGGYVKYESGAYINPFAQELKVTGTYIGTRTDPTNAELLVLNNDTLSTIPYPFPDSANYIPFSVKFTSHAGITTPKFRIYGDGKLKIASGYANGTFTGTATYNLSVDASGNVIATTASGGGGLSGGNLGAGYRYYVPSSSGIKTTIASNGLTLDSATSNILTYKWGGTLTGATTIVQAGSNINHTGIGTNVFGDAPYIGTSTAKLQVNNHPTLPLINIGNIPVDGIPIWFGYRDTLTAANVASKTGRLFQTQRQLYITENGLTITGKNANAFGLSVQAKDSVYFYTLGGDLQYGTIAALNFGKISGQTSRTVIQGGSVDFDAVPAFQGEISTFSSTSASNNMVLRGYFSGFTSFINFKQYDSLRGEWIGFLSNGYNGNGGKILKFTDFYGGAVPADSAWFVKNLYKYKKYNIMAAPLALGDSMNTGPINALEVTGNVKLYTIPSSNAASDSMMVWNPTTRLVGYRPVPSGGGSGVTTLAAIGSSPNANGATIASTTLNLEPASASFGGVVTTGTQTFAGAKTFASVTVSALTSGRLVQAGASGLLTDNAAFTVDNTLKNLTIEGTSASVSASPKLLLKYSGDANYVFGFFPYGHDNLYLNFDDYYDAVNGWTSSYVGSNFNLVKNGDKLFIGVNSGTAAGSTFSGPTKVFSWDVNGNVEQQYGTYSLGFGGSASAKLHIRSTTAQEEIDYDASNYYNTTVSSAGNVAWNAVGSSSGFSIADNVSIGGTSTSSTQLLLSGSSSSSISALRITGSVAVSSPVNGDVWVASGNELFMRLNSITRKLDNNLVLSAATDANVVVPRLWVYYDLITISANRTVTLPTGVGGEEIILHVTNSTGNTWSVTGSATIQDAAGNTITNLTNDTVYRLIALSSTVWLKEN